MAYGTHERLIADRLPEDARNDAVVWVFADNFRQRRVLCLLRGAADGGAMNGPVLRAVNDFLCNDMILHMRSEEEDLFPLLRVRCRPDDPLDRLLDVLASDHEAQRLAITQIGSDLGSLPAAAVAVPLSPPLRRLMIAFADAMKWHILAENTRLLPHVRERLSSREIVDVGRRAMTRRRPQPGVEATSGQPRSDAIGGARL